MMDDGWGRGLVPLFPRASGAAAVQADLVRIIRIRNDKDGQNEGKVRDSAGTLDFMGVCFSSGAESAAHPHPQPHPHAPRISGRKRRRRTSFPGEEECSTLSTPNKSSLKIMETPTSLPPPSKNVEDLRESPGYQNVDIFTYHEMRLATKHFRPDLIVGEGGFGVVYRGILHEDVRRGYDATQVAIKELNRQGFQGDREWLAEVNYLGQFSHPNLVKLIGYCCEDDHRLLVYEYMAGGSLEKHLFRRVGCPLTWSRRMKIALDAAKGLAFLHGAERSIIYRDFKTSNVLLDADFNAKLSDFGLAKDGPVGDQTHVSTRVMGTYGYAAPEYVMTGHLTARSDVYGFGVVLLEMLIGRRAMDKTKPSREHNLVEWARPLLNNNRKLLKILDPRVEGQYSVKTAMKVASLAYQCLSQNPKGRPLMSQVVEILGDLQGEEDNQEELLPEGWGGGGSVTLFEFRKGDDNDGGSASKAEGHRGEVQRNQQTYQRSNGEPPP